MLPDPAEVMLGKARQDHLLAARIVDDALTTDEHIGFFCQQAIEKAMKAVLSHKGIRYRRTHDLAELLDLLMERRVSARRGSMNAWRSRRSQWRCAMTFCRLI